MRPKRVRLGESWAQGEEQRTDPGGEPWRAIATASCAANVARIGPGSRSPSLLPRGARLACPGPRVIPVEQGTLNGMQSFGPRKAVRNRRLAGGRAALRARTGTPTSAAGREKFAEPDR